MISVDAVYSSVPVFPAKSFRLATNIEAIIYVFFDC